MSKYFFDFKNALWKMYFDCLGGKAFIAGVMSVKHIMARKRVLL